MSVVIRLARAGTKKRPVYHVVVADVRAVALGARRAVAFAVGTRRVIPTSTY